LQQKGPPGPVNSGQAQDNAIRFEHGILSLAQDFTLGRYRLKGRIFIYPGAVFLRVNTRAADEKDSGLPETGDEIGRTIAINATILSRITSTGAGTPDDEVTLKPISLDFFAIAEIDGGPTNGEAAVSNIARASPGGYVPSVSLEKFRRCDANVAATRDENAGHLSDGRDFDFAKWI
jgi:hypothetical protein